MIIEHTDPAYWNNLLEKISQDLLGIEMESANVYDCIEAFNEANENRIQYVVAKGVVHVSSDSKEHIRTAVKNSAKWAMNFCENVVPAMSIQRMSCPLRLL